MQQELRDFFTQQPALHFKKGDIIHHAFDATADIFYLESGHVRVYTLTAGGDEKIYVFFKPGTLFPITRIFSNAQHNLYYEAMETVTVYKVPQKQFLQFIQNKPQVLLDVIRLIIDVHNIYIDRVDTLEYTNTYARLLSRLLSLAKSFGQVKGKEIYLSIPVTHQDIANTTAMTRETTSRELDRLKKKGLLSTHGHTLVITDIRLLEEELRRAAEKSLL